MGQQMLVNEIVLSNLTINFHYFIYRFSPFNEKWFSSKSNPKNFSFSA